jgi:transposase-like protein
VEKAEGETMSQNENSQYQDPEVEPRAARRQYTAEYKQGILDEIDAATQPGEKGAILRREGLYSQLISKWRAQQARNGLEAQKRGPKANPASSELVQLRRENERLRKKLEKAELIIDVQKKVSQMFELDENDQRETNASR